MFPILNKQAISLCWSTFTKIWAGLALFPRTQVTGKPSKPSPKPYPQFSWLTGSTLLLLAATSSPVAAQRILLDETFTGPAVKNPRNWIFGIGERRISDPPCLTAAPLTGPAPPQFGNGQGIPRCRDSTTGANPPASLDPPGQGVLRLTPSIVDQESFVLYNDPQNPLPSRNGLVITFDFFTYNGSGADGISFFLTDARTPPTEAGAFGGSLGYAPCFNSLPNCPGETINGIRGGYVGVGFDEYGNFSDPVDNRKGGGGPGRIPDTVSIRGRADGAPPYQYLIGTGDADLAAQQAIINANGGLDFPALQTRSNAIKRRVRITLTPDNKISVDIDFKGTGFLNIIRSLNLEQVQGRIPEFFNFGFGASTGQLRNIHEIQNLRITTVPPDLRITKTGPESFTVGQQASYTLTVRNSPSAGATTDPVTVTDTLPPGFDFISATGTNWICSADGSIVTCNYAEAALPLRPGAVAKPITIAVLPTAAADNPSINTAKVATTGDDPDNPPRPPDDRTKDNTDSIKTPVIAAPLLDSTKAAQLNDSNGNGIGDPGEVITYTMTLVNNGNAPSTDTVLTDTAPQNTTYVPNSTTLNGTILADAAGNTPLADGELVNSPNEPLGSGTVNPGEAQAAIVSFQVRINNPLPPNITEIKNIASVGSTQVPPTSIVPPNPIPTAPGEPRLRLLKRITQVNTTPYSNLVDDPADSNDNPGIWPTTLQPVGLPRLDPQAPLTSGDEVEYTIYFLSDGTQNIQTLKLCDPIPAKTTFIDNSFGPGRGLLLNQGGTQTPLTNVLDTDQGTFASPLTPVTPPCPDTNNPTGAVVWQLGEVPNTAPNNVGFVRFRVKID